MNSHTPMASYKALPQQAQHSEAESQVYPATLNSDASLPPLHRDIAHSAIVIGLTPSTRKWDASVGQSAG